MVITNPAEILLIAIRVFAIAVKVLIVIAFRAANNEIEQKILAMHAKGMGQRSSDSNRQSS